MSYLYILFASLVISLTSITDVPHSQIESAFNRNSSDGIVSLSKEKVLINIFGKEGAYSHSQANLVLKDFFSKKPNGAFTFIFKGKESENGTFSIGNYTHQGTVMRVTIHFKKESSGFLIETLTIE
ncbi:MAG: hypothetical protein ACI9XP_001872 [Lentimonas sp.]|jgi:hypothetical protein